MHRIDGAGATADHKFTDGDPVGGIPATVVTDDWLNDVQEELISVLAAAGIAPVKGTQNQLLAAIRSQIATVQGAFKNLVASTTGASAVVTLTADEIVLKSAANAYVTLRNVSLTASTGAASGAANSLDAGLWAFSTWYARHVIYNPTTTTAALLWSLSKTTPTLPAGYTFSAFTGWERTQSATNFNPLAILWAGLRGSYVKGAAGNTQALPIMASGVVGNAGLGTYAAVAWANFAPPDTSELDILARAGTPGASMACAPNNNYSGAGNTTAAAPPIAYIPSGGAGNSALSVRQLMPVESSNIYYLSDDATYSMLQCCGFKIRG